MNPHLDGVGHAAEGLRPEEGEHVAVEVDDLEEVELVEGAGGDVADDVVGEGELLEVGRRGHEVGAVVI